MAWPIGGIFGFLWCIAATSLVSHNVNDINDSFATLGLDINPVSLTTAT